MNDSLQRVAAELRASDAVVLVGAGASIAAGYPLTIQLRPHLWNAIEADPRLLERLAVELGRDAESAKQLVGDDPEACRVAYEAVTRSPGARKAFQQSFRELDIGRVHAFSPTHDAIAELLHRRMVETVVSMNWDSLLEASFARRYGRLLRADGTWLHKPHGDVAEPDSPWVLPHDPGAIPDALVEQMAALARARPRILIIVGYSESDEAVVDRLISPLSSKWRVARIGPSAAGELAVRRPADEAMSAIRDLATGGTDELPGWEYVTYQKQNDLGHALAGRALGAGDVQACPRLPEVDSVVRDLRTAHAATVLGDPGSGKSATAHQAAFELLSEGVEVVRLRERDRATDELVAGLQGLRTPTVVMLDDAQNLRSDFVRRVRDLASSDVRVLVVSNSTTTGALGEIRILGKQAVRCIAESLRERADETLSVVSKFRDEFDRAWLEARFDLLLDEAARADYPWQFSFILTSGERRAGSQIREARRVERADLLLLLVAARQLVTRDAGATEKDLDQLANTMGRDSVWAARVLGELSARRLLVISDGVIRCSHQRHADKILQLVCSDRKDPEWPNIVNALREVVLLRQPELAGVAVLLRGLWFAEGFRWSREGTIVTDAVWTTLTTRCLKAESDAERGGAGYLLEALKGYHPALSDWIAGNSRRLASWISRASPESANGLATLLNSLHDSPSLSALVSQVDGPAVANAVVASATRDRRAWGSLLGRLALGRDAALPLGAALRDRREPLIASAAGAGADDAPYHASLANGIASLEPDVSLELIENIGDAIGERINQDFSSAYDEFHHTFWFVLGLAPKDFRFKEPTTQQKRVARRVFRSVESARVAQSISCSPRWALASCARLLAVVAKANRHLGEQIALRIDLRQIDERIRDLWADPPDDLLEFIGVLGRLGSVESFEPARSWIARHEGDLQSIPARLVVMAPETAVAACRRGAVVDLKLSGVLGWGLPAVAIYEIAKRDVLQAKRAVTEHVDAMASELMIRQPNQCEHLHYFVAIVQETAPDALMDAFAKMDPPSVAEAWQSRLRGKAVERRAAAVLVRAALDSPNLASVAKDLRHRFPKASCPAEE